MSPDAPTTDDLAHVLDAIDADTPPALEVAERLADATGVDVDTAQRVVWDAIDDGVLVEEGEGFGGVRLGDDREPAEPSKSANRNPEEPDTEDANPGGETGETGGEGDVSRYRRVYLDAVERAGREPWEFVEEAAVRSALDRIGFAELLDNGDLFQIRGWRFVDVSDDGEDPRRRWYYPSGHEPRPEEFRRFHQALTANAPDGYEPHYFKVQRAGKAPATRFGSWKTDEARLTADEAVEWLREGGNVGVAGRPDDPLINVDIDDDEETTPADVPTSLRARSRSRTGWHTWYFDRDGEVPNIPTDEYGEVRTDWQYVVAPGSFVASTGEEIPDDADAPGYYTVKEEAPVAAIEYDDLPEVFREVAESVEEDDTDETPADGAGEAADTTGRSNDGRSAVFDVEAADLVPATDAGERFTSIFHDSETGANMSVSGDKLHCWRHGVAHGGLQALATLSGEVSYGCRELGAAHKHSNAGSNTLKGDWRLVWAAWHEAKRRGAVPTDDPVPYRALRGVAVRDGLVDGDDLVDRDSETGEVVTDPDAHDGDTYRALPSGAYDEVLDHIEDAYGVDSGRDRVGSGGDTDTGESAEECRRDPRELGATVDTRRAWDAAGRVEPGDLPADHGLPTGDGDAFACPACGDTVDVVRAVAIAEDLVETCDATLDEAYPEAYAIAREEYAAPLPEYYTTSDAIAEFDAVLDVISEVVFWDLDTDALDTEITEEGDEVGGEGVRALNPAWRESDSEASVLVFDSGTVWDADSERVLDTLRFVALDSGLIDDPSEAVAGEAFTEAYRRCRTEYGAPLPRWEPAADGAREITPQLPPSEELVDTRDLDGVGLDALEAAREEVESLVAAAAADTEEPTVVTALPALGKTTGAVKTARERPLSYLPPRKELQADALDKADDWGVDAEVLPVLSEERVRDEVLSAAVAHVREHGTDRLRDRWAVLTAALNDVEDTEDAESVADPDDIFVEEDDDSDEVDLPRATCPTAEGDHGVAWALAVHVARRLGYRPSDIHGEAGGLFGAPLPCTCDEDDDADEAAECPYSAAWSDVADPDDPADLLVGSYVHAHVESVRTEYGRDADGGVERAPRALVLDEFPGEAFVRGLDDEALDFATWLARALRDDVDDRRDMYETDLWGDDWVRAWLDGRGDEVDSVSDAAETLARARDVLDTREAATEILDEVDTGALEAIHLDTPLQRLAGGDDAAETLTDLEARLDDVPRDHPAAALAGWIRDAVADPLGEATDGGRATTDPSAVDTDALPVAGDLEALVEDAIAAATEGEDGAGAMLSAAADALRGGSAGCRRLAAWATDGYAHPEAHHLLQAVATPTGAESGVEDATRVDTSSWAFDPDATDGTVVDVVDTGERATAVVDRNGHGARLHTPPARTTGDGDEVPLVGLDATGRAELWEVALGEAVDTADIHDTPADRAAFLEDALDLRVLQADDRPRYYSGDPSTKDTDGDVALLEAVADEYAGIEAPRQRGDEATVVGKPGAITTKDVREVLENDTRLDDVVGTWDHYGNVKGSNELGDHRLAAILGTQHYGDDTIERFAALAGEAVDTDRGRGRGAGLDYDSDLANAYLQHMTEDQTMQAILRFARGDSGATVVARTGALREDLPVVGDAQVVETWSETATAIAREYRRLGGDFTAADVRDAVDVGPRQVRRVLAELVDAGYLRRVDSGAGRASVYERADDPGAGEVDLPERADSGEAGGSPGRSVSNQYYTWNVRVHGGECRARPAGEPAPVRQRGAPPSPTAVDGVEPPG